MNINALIQGFASYLEELNKISNKNYNTSAKNASVFMYSTEFKNYLQQEFGADKSISSLSISDIMNLDVVNGKLVEKTNNDVSNTFSDNPTSEEGQETADSANQDENANQMFGGEEFSLGDILNDLFNDDKVKNTLDTDKSGDLSKDEINTFLDSIKNFDNDDTNVSLDDIMKAAESINDGSFQLNPQSEETPAGDTPAAETPENATPASGTNGANGANGASGSSGGGNGGGGSYDTGATPEAGAQNGGLESMSLSELESKKTEKEGELKTAQDDVSAVYSGENANVKAAQEDADKAKEEYDKVLEDDEQVSQDLKEQKAANDTAISESEGKINKFESDINTKENEITAQNSVIAADNAEIDALNSAISSLNSQSSDDEKTKADIASKKASAEAKLKAAKAKLEADKKKLTDLENDKKNLETDLAAEKETLSGLVTEKAAIEEKILETCKPETKTAMETYNTAKENIDTVKAEELDKAKAAVETKQAELDEINNQINVKKAEEVKSTYSVNSLDNPQQLYDSLGLKEKGLDYKVFESAIKGYQNLMKQQDGSQENSGILAIFDTTTQQVYSIDLKKGEYREKCKVVLGSGVGKMSNVEAANQEGSHATLSGFFQVGDIYNSGHHKTGWTQGINVYGLEDGINDNCYDKRCVIHPTNAGSTYGCWGVKGTFDMNKIQNLFPPGSYIFNYTKSDYFSKSKLY